MQASDVSGNPDKVITSSISRQLLLAQKQMIDSVQVDVTRFHRQVEDGVGIS